MSRISFQLLSPGAYAITDVDQSNQAISVIAPLVIDHIGIRINENRIRIQGLYMEGTDPLVAFDEGAPEIAPGTFALAPPMQDRQGLAVELLGEAARQLLELRVGVDDALFVPKLGNGDRQGNAIEKPPKLIVVERGCEVGRGKQLFDGSQFIFVGSHRSPRWRPLTATQPGK